MGFSGSAFSFFIRRTDIDFFVRISSYFNVLSESIVLIHIFCIFLYFTILGFSVVLGRLKLVPQGVELRPWRSLEVRGSPELQNGGLRALEEAWDDFLLEAFSCQVCSFSVILGRLKLVPEGNS